MQTEPLIIPIASSVVDQRDHRGYYVRRRAGWQLPQTTRTKAKRNIARATNIIITASLSTLIDTLRCCSHQIQNFIFEA